VYLKFLGTAFAGFNEKTLQLIQDNTKGSRPITEIETGISSLGESISVSGVERATPPLFDVHRFTRFA
jgi:hypothetical protein